MIYDKAEFPIVGGRGGGACGALPHSMIFFENPPHQNWCPWGYGAPPLKDEAPLPSEKQPHPPWL